MTRRQLYVLTNHGPHQDPAADAISVAFGSLRDALRQVRRIQVMRSQSGVTPARLSLKRVSQLVVGGV